MTEPAAAPSTRSRALRIVGNVLAVVGVVFVVLTVKRHLTSMPTVPLTSATVTVLALGVLANIGALLLAATAWRALLVGVGERHGWRDCFSILGRANLAKYVPGNVFHLVGRASLAASWSTPMPLIVATMTVETLLVLAVAGVLGVPAALSRLQLLVQTLTSSSASTLLAMLPALVIAGAVAVVVALAVLLRRRGVGMKPSAIAVVVACDVITTLIVGSSLHALLIVVFAAAAMPWWLCVSGYSLAWVLGFVTPGAPGGVGVREAVFLVLAAPAGDGDVVAAALAAAVVVSRLQSILADVIVFVVARAVGPR